MKYLLMLLLLGATTAARSQKYVLLDEAFVQQAVYKNRLNEMEKYKKFFPVEVKELPRFIQILEQISGHLSEKKVTGPARNYTAGCTKFTGKVFPLATGERIDYVLTSDCDGIKVTMHLCDAKLSNANNAYFVKTWIKYIRSTTGRH